MRSLGHSRAQEYKGLQKPPPVGVSTSPEGASAPSSPQTRPSEATERAPLNSSASSEPARARSTHCTSCPSLGPRAWSLLTDSLTRPTSLQALKTNPQWGQGFIQPAANLPSPLQPWAADNSAPWGVQGWPCLKPRQGPRGAHPLSWPPSHPRGSPLAGRSCPAPGSARPLPSLEDLSPEEAWGPIYTNLSNQRLWDRVQSGVAPAVHPEHVLFFWLYLLELSEMSF